MGAEYNKFRAAKIQQRKAKGEGDEKPGKEGSKTGKDRYGRDGEPTRGEYAKGMKAGIPKGKMVKEHEAVPLEKNGGAKYSMNKDKAEDGHNSPGGIDTTKTKSPKPKAIDAKDSTNAATGLKQGVDEQVRRTIQEYGEAHAAHQRAQAKVLALAYDGGQKQ
jgi:hypothetical protein